MSTNHGPQRAPSSVGRIEAQAKAIRRELDEHAKPATFVCKNCGTATEESERCPHTGECIYCEPGMGGYAKLPTRTEIEREAMVKLVREIFG